MKPDTLAFSSLFNLCVGSGSHWIWIFVAFPWLKTDWGLWQLWGEKHDNMNMSQGVVKAVLNLKLEGLRYNTQSIVHSSRASTTTTTTDNVDVMSLRHVHMCGSQGSLWLLSATLCYRRNKNLGFLQNPHIALSNVDIDEADKAPRVFCVLVKGTSFLLGTEHMFYVMYCKKRIEHSDGWLTLPCI